MDNTFDILNTRYRSEGTKTRNKWNLPLSTTDDLRFGVGKTAFNNHNTGFQTVRLHHLNKAKNSTANMLLKQYISLAGITARIKVRLWSNGKTSETMRNLCLRQHHNKLY